ncbi:MAG: hypothetical protein ACKVT0_04445 [Planctomycetaceae bacterium]
MKRYLLRFLTLISLLICLTTGFLWGVSHYMQASIAWSQGREMYELSSSCGTIYWIQNHDWWREEKVRCQYVLNPEGISVDEWVGTRNVTSSEFLGVVYAHGEWISPYLEVSADTVITRPDLHIEPRTMYSSITPFEAYGVPYWMIVLISSVLPINILAKKIRARLHSSGIPIGERRQLIHDNYQASLKELEQQELTFTSKTSVLREMLSRD